MFSIERELAKQLKQQRVRVDMPDGDTVFLRNVPTAESFFNKPRTNLLIKRPREAMPFVVCVDEDLEYVGGDIALIRAFKSGHRQQGWRVLAVEQDRRASCHKIVEDALGILGFGGQKPAIGRPVAGAFEPTAPTTNPVLESFGTDLSHLAMEEKLDPTIGREEKIEQLLSCLLQWQAQMPVIAGESGVGKTNLLHGVARKLKQCRPALRVISMDLGLLMAGTLFDCERENLLVALIKEASDQKETVLAIEHLELAVKGAPRGLLILANALDKSVKVTGTTLPDFLPAFDAPPLSRRAQVVELEEMSLRETAEVLSALRDRIAQHHLVKIDDSLLQAAIDAACLFDGRMPAKAISLLDAAAARAVLAGEIEVSLYDIYEASARFRADESQAL